MSNSDRHVHALVNQVHYPIQEQEAYLHGRIGAEESIHQRTDVKAPEKRRGGYGKYPARRAPLTGREQLRLFELGQNVSQVAMYRSPASVSRNTRVVR